MIYFDEYIAHLFIKVFQSIFTIVIQNILLKKIETLLIYF